MPHALASIYSYEICHIEQERICICRSKWGTFYSIAVRGRKYHDLGHSMVRIICDERWISDALFENIFTDLLPHT